MDASAGFPVERMMQLCEARGLRPARVGVMAGLSSDYIRNLERGTVQEPTFAKLAAIADVLETNPLYLAEMINDARPTKDLDGGERLQIETQIGLGLWRDDRAFFQPVPSDMTAATTHAGERQFGAVLVDSSMSGLCMPRGAVLHCVKTTATPSAALNGGVVLLRRTSGQLSELSARRCRMRGGVLECVTVPSHGEAVAVDTLGPNAAICAVVIGAYLSLDPNSLPNYL